MEVSQSVSQHYVYGRQRHTSGVQTDSTTQFTCAQKLTDSHLNLAHGAKSRTVMKNYEQRLS